MTAVLLGDLNMLRCFVGAGIPLVVAPSADDTTVLASRFATSARVTADFSDPEAAIADLEALARELHERPVLFYGNDRQLLAISRHRERLEPLYRFTMPPADVIEMLVDKKRFAQRADSLSLPVPQSSLDHACVDHVISHVPPPYVIKPTNHIGWFMRPQKAIIANTEDELVYWYDEVCRHTRDFIVQRWIPGGEEFIYSYHAYVDAKGHVLGEFVGKKIRTWPKEAGASTYIELVHEPRAIALGREVVAKLELIGPLKIDLKMHPETGELFVLEVNPRFNLWHHLGAVCGVNLPRIAYDDLTGVRVEPQSSYSTSVRWLAFPDDVRAFVRGYHPAGLGFFDWVQSLRGPKVYDVFDWPDPLPWAASILKELVRR